MGSLEERGLVQFFAYFGHFPRSLKLLKLERFFFFSLKTLYTITCLYISGRNLKQNYLIHIYGHFEIYSLIDYFILLPVVDWNDS